MRARLGTWYARIASRLVPGVTGRLPKADHGPRTVHLSFDDGPTESTLELLELLDEFAIPATFYLLGEQAERFPGQVAEIVRRGHAVGNHSMTHRDAWKSSRDEIERDLDEGSNILEKLTGTRPATMRPPFGRLNRDVVRWSRRNEQPITLWDLMPPDFDVAATAGQVSRTLERGLRSRSIVVMHDNEKSRGRTIPALRESLPRLLKAGWRFVPLSLVEQPEPGRRAA